MDQPVTLITGSRQGIGRYLVSHYTGLGHSVVGCSRQPFPEKIERYEHFCVDIADEDRVRAMMQCIWEKYGRLDHIINNAALVSTGHILLETAASVRRTYETNVLGTVLVCREGARWMKKRRYGRVVNLSSTSRPLKLAGTAVYASSKAAVESLTEILAQELASFGITVNAVGPALVESETLRKMPAEQARECINRHAIRRPGTFAEVAHALDFFLHSDSGFVTGQVLYLGGP
jgi:3-oxoacyl-[acyl-carrier protein] reductase